MPNPVIPDPDYYLLLQIVYDNTTTDLDLSAYVAAITPSFQRRNVKSITAIDGTEYAFPMQRKHQLKVDFKPMSGAALKTLYDFLTNTPWQVWYRVKYRDPTASGETITVNKMRIANEFETKYLLKSVDTNRYYGGMSLELREQ